MATKKKRAQVHGLRTAVYHVRDMKKAKAWYMKVPGVKPYFGMPQVYIGFNGGGIKLGTVKDPFGNLLGVIENPQFTISPQ